MLHTLAKSGYEAELVRVIPLSVGLQPTFRRERRPYPRHNAYDDSSYLGYVTLIDIVHNCG